MGGSLFVLGALSLLLLAMVYVLSLFFPENEYLSQLKEQKYINGFLLTALVCFGLGILLRIIYPMKRIFKNRCKKCNAPIPQGDTYCTTCLRDMKYYGR